MSNAAKFEVPDSGDNGKAYIYSSGSDSHVLTDVATQAELDAHAADTTSVHGITDTADLLTKLWAAATAAGQAVEIGNGTQAVAIWAEAGGPSIGSKDDSRLLIEAQARWDSDDDGVEGTGIDINKPAVVLRQTGEDHKGALIEFQQYLAAGTHNFGTATDSYPGTFSVGSAGYKRVGWILAHYDSPNPADGIHQHMNFETVQADLSTIVTRFQISWGEDIALASFPNSHVRFYDDKEVRFGSDDDVTLKFDTATGRIVATGATWRFGTGSSSVWIDVTNGRLGVGPSLSAPSAPLHLERADDGQSILARNTTVAGNTGAVIKAETQTAASRVFQSGIQTTDSTARFSIETSGKMEWGAGSASARDTNLYRSAADTLKTDDNLVVGGTLTIGADTVQEVIRDTMGTALVAGSNISITPNDGADTITIAASGGGSFAAGLTQHPRIGSGYWHGPPGLNGSPTTSAWPAINRLYGVPFTWPQAVSISAFGVNVTAAGAAGVVVRIAAFLMQNGLPTTLLDQGTVAGDSIGAKTLTLGSAINVPAGTPVIVFAGPQGAGAAGSTWFPSQFPISWTAAPESGASWNGTFQLAMYTAAAGALSSSPTVFEESVGRMPYISARLS